MQAFSSPEERIISAVRILLAVTAPFWVYSLLFPSDYAYAAGLVIAPLLVLVNMLVVVWVSRQDEHLAKLLPIAFLLKLAAAAMYLLLVHHEGGDLIGYNHFGSRIASDFLITRDWSIFTATRPVWRGPNLFIGDLVALLYIVTAPSISVAMVVFSTISFWGQYFAYRAFTIGFPNGQRGRAALLLLLFPSNVFWTATVGKDAVIALSIWLATYGFARLVHMPGIRAYLYLAIGLAGASLVRPHIAAILAIAFTVSYVFGRNLRGSFGVTIKIATIPLLAYGCFWLITKAGRFINAENVSQALLVARNVSHNTNIGGSAIGAPSSPLFFRIVSAPFLLFRPFPWEINNLQAAIASVEALFLACLFWVYRGRLKAAARGWRSHPFLLFLLLYVIEFSVMGGVVFSNIGLIARQRVMMLPAVLMLLCFSPAFGSPDESRRNLPARFRWRPEGGTLARNRAVRETLPGYPTQERRLS